MAINFSHYPTSNRVPGVFVEVDASQANTGTQLQSTLLIGQKTAVGTAVPDTPVQVESLGQVLGLCGQGSILAAMAQRYLQRDNFGDLWLLPLVDPAAGVAATGTITITGNATASGTLNIYIGGQRLQVGVTTGDTPTIIAGNINVALNANDDLPVTSTVAAGVVTMTALNKGLLGNDINLQANYAGTAGGEYPVPGVTVAFAPMAGGTANPTLTAGLANLSSHPYDFICTPYNDTPSLNALQSFLADDVGRWSWQSMIYGGAFSAFRGTLGACTAFGTGRNDQHMSVMAFNGSPDPVWIWAAEYCAAAAASLRVDPGLPLQYINTTLQAPPVANRWMLGERNTLLYDGMSTTRVGDDGTVIIERAATTYQKNAAGAIDNSYLDVETLYGLMFVARQMSDYLLTRYARKKLVSDATPIQYGSNCVSAALIKASVIVDYRALEQQGYVQNSAIFARNVVVENAGNGLIKVLAPVDLVNQLRQIAILLQFKKS